MAKKFILLVGILLILTLSISFLWKKDQPVIIWKIEAKNIIANLYLNDNIIYAPTLDNYFEAINAQDGKIIWKYQVDSYILEQPKVFQNIISFTSKMGTIYQLNRITGENIPNSQRIKLENKDFDFSNDYSFVKGIIKLNQTAYHIETKYYFPGDSSYRILYASDEKTGGKKWDWPENINTYPLVGNSSIYFISGDYLYSVK